MSLCIASTAAALALATQAFTLSWVHSVERVEWREWWRVANGSLQLVRASVKGSGAGMEPPPGARLIDGAWSYEPNLPPQAELWLAVSGATPSGWRLCDDEGRCHELEVELAPPGSGAQRLRVWVGGTCERLAAPEVQKPAASPGPR